MHSWKYLKSEAPNIFCGPGNTGNLTVVVSCIPGNIGNLVSNIFLCCCKYRNTECPAFSAILEVLQMSLLVNIISWHSFLKTWTKKVALPFKTILLNFQNMAPQSKPLCSAVCFPDSAQVGGLALHISLIWGQIF